MAEGANVKSIDSIKEFRVYLAKFGESCSLALGDSDSEISKTMTWLEGEQQTWWNGQIRKRQEVVAKAEDAYRYKKLYKDSTGSSPSAIEELKAVNIAKKNLADAMQKLANVKRSIRLLLKEMTIYHGGVGRFSNAISSGVPQAIAELAGKIDMLEKYVGIDAGVGAGESLQPAGAGALGSDQTGPSMSRSPDMAPTEPVEFDIKALRALVPTGEALAAIPLAEGSVQSKPVNIPPEQQAVIEALAGESAVGGEDRVAIASGAGSGRQIAVRVAAGSFSIWYVAPVDATAATEYNIISAAELLAGHPDLRSLLSLPTGYLAVIDQKGVTAIFDDKNQNRWNPPPQPAASAG